MNKLKFTNELSNFRTIKNGNLIYTLNDYVIQILDIENINIQLLSEKKCENLANLLSRELQAYLLNVKILHFTQNLDINNILYKISKYIKKTDSIEKKNYLKEYKRFLIQESLEGNIIVPKTYIVLWDKANEQSIKKLIKKTESIKLAFQNATCNSTELKDTSLVEICSLYNCGSLSRNIDISKNEIIAFQKGVLNEK